MLASVSVFRVVMGISSTPQMSDQLTEGASPVCVAVRACLDEFIDGEMSEIKTATIASHLHSCAACRRAETALRSLVERLRQTPVAASAPRRLRLQVAQLFDAHASRDR